MRNRSFWGCCRGNTAVVFGLVAGPLAATAMGGLDVFIASNERARLQDAADAGALAGATRLSIASSDSMFDGPERFAETTAMSQLQNVSGSTEVEFTAHVDPQTGTVTVNGIARRQPLLASMGFGPQRIEVAAVAEGLQKVPLCVLQTNSTQLRLQNTAYLRAPGCGVHANGSLSVAGGAMIEASSIQSAGSVSGITQPRANAGAMQIPDPFAGLDLSPPTQCEGKPEKVKVHDAGNLTLAPGVHCEDIDVKNSAKLVLAPGEHYFMGKLDMKHNSSIAGHDVVLFFGRDKAFSFADKGAVQLSARKSGPYAGFLIVTTRDNDAKFTISSDKVSELLGTIYIPSAELVIETAGSVAQDSAWSVIVANTLTLKSNPVLVINRGYAGSGVPVPSGVGPSRASPVLSR